MNEETRPQANRFVKGLSIFVGINGLYIFSWPFDYILFTEPRMFIGFGGMLISILIGSLMIKTPFQVFRDYSKTALAGVILGTMISLALDGIMIMGWAPQAFNL